MKYYAIIVAGGSGTRMAAGIPKQFMVVAGQPLLMHTVEAFHYSDLKPSILLVLHKDYHLYWRELCQQTGFDLPVTLVTGGRERFHSVKNALKYVESPAIVAVHDAVRPAVGNDLITDAFRQAEELGNAVTAVPSRDSVRLVDPAGTSVVLDRNAVFLIQTPQVFTADILKNAYRQAFSEAFTDDASVVEKSGVGIRLITGDHSNIKVTFPADILVAEQLLSTKKIRR